MAQRRRRRSNNLTQKAKDGIHAARRVWNTLGFDDLREILKVQLASGSKEGLCNRSETAKQVIEELIATAEGLGVVRRPLDILRAVVRHLEAANGAGGNEWCRSLDAAESKRQEAFNMMVRHIRTVSLSYAAWNRLKQRAMQLKTARKRSVEWLSIRQSTT